ncbi:MAG: Asp-tRNA(Asn)/Glu-tRNA(Gln) amidotransferase subunit GatB, partial [Bacteroidia bacterium]
LIEAGKEVAVETRSFNATDGSTFSLRSKEAANDYRYFPEPDLQPVYITENYIKEVKQSLPELPNVLHKRYVKEFSLSEYDAAVLTDSKEIALYFNELVKHTKNYKAASNWLTVNIKSYLNENAVHIAQFPVKAEQIAQLITIIDEGKISHSSASQKIFPELIKDPSKSPLQIAQELNLIQESNTDALQDLVNQAIAKYPEKVAEYKNGKVTLLGLFMGEVMKLSKGKADPKVTSALVKETLDKA